MNGRAERFGGEGGQDEQRRQEALLERAQKAVESAAEILATSQVLTTVATDRRLGALTSRCAWCGRYRIDEAWVKVSPNVMVDQTETTHGICEDCVAALRCAGLSA